MQKIKFIPPFSCDFAMILQTCDFGYFEYAGYGQEKRWHHNVENFGVYLHAKIKLFSQLSLRYC